MPKTQEKPNWPETALFVLTSYTRYHEKPFETREIRGWAYRIGLPRPGSETAWGQVIMRGKKIGVITKDTMRSTSTKNVWKAI